MPLPLMEGDSEKRKSTALKGGESDSIRVICRFRPPKAVEIEMHGQSGKLENFMIDEARGTVTVDIDFERKSFAYDKVFSFVIQMKGDRFLELVAHKLRYFVRHRSPSHLHKIFQSISNTVDAVMLGFNGTILAYGQTSSGCQIRNLF